VEEELTELERRLSGGVLLSKKPEEVIMTKKGFIAFSIVDKKMPSLTFYTFKKYRGTEVETDLMKALEDEMRSGGIKGEPITIGGGR